MHSRCVNQGGDSGLSAACWLALIMHVMEMNVRSSAQLLPNCYVYGDWRGKWVGMEGRREGEWRGWQCEGFRRSCAARTAGLTWDGHGRQHTQESR